MNAPKAIEEAALARLARARQQIDRSLLMEAEGNPLGAEYDEVRLVSRLQAKAQLSREEALAIASGIRLQVSRVEAARGEALPKAVGPERIWGGTIDFVGVAFLARGARAARAVARVGFRDGRPQGSGFLISDRLFLTNNHVIGSQAEAAGLMLEFDYEIDPRDLRREPTRFALDPATFFLTSERDDLDFTIIAVGDRLEGPTVLEEYGSCALSGASDKHALGEVANIVQHPDGRYKEVVLRENCRFSKGRDPFLRFFSERFPPRG